MDRSWADPREPKSEPLPREVGRYHPTTSSTSHATLEGNAETQFETVWQWRQALAVTLR